MKNWEEKDKKKVQKQKKEICVQVYFW
jgi:hypothetical protein